MQRRLGLVKLGPELRDGLGFGVLVAPTLLCLMGCESRLERILPDWRFSISDLAPSRCRPGGSVPP